MEKDINEKGSNRQMEEVKALESINDNLESIAVSLEGILALMPKEK